MLVDAAKDTVGSYGPEAVQASFPSTRAHVEEVDDESLTKPESPTYVSSGKFPTTKAVFVVSGTPATW